MLDLEKKSLNSFFLFIPKYGKQKILDSVLFFGLLCSVLFFPFIPITHEFFLSLDEVFVILVAIRVLFLRFFWIDKFVVFLLIFGCYVAFTILINNHRGEIREYFELYKYFKLVVLYVFSIYFFLNRDHKGQVKKFIIVSFIIMVIFNFLHYFDLVNFNENVTILYDSDQRDTIRFGLNSLGLPAAKRIIGTMGNPNDNSILFLFYFAIFQSKLVSSKFKLNEEDKKEQKQYYILYFAALLLVIMCQSRTGIIAGSILFIIGLFHRKATLKMILIDLLIIVGIIGIIYGLDHMSIQYLSNTRMNIDENTSFLGRLEVWKKLCSEWIHKPIFGYGPNKEYMYANKLYPENGFIFHLWRYGIIGLVFYCIALWYLFIKFMRESVQINMFSYSVIFISVCALANNPISNPKFLIIFAIVFGYAMSEYYQRKLKDHEVS